MKLLLEKITRKAKIIDMAGRRRLIDNSNLTQFFQIGWFGLANSQDSGQNRMFLYCEHGLI